MSTGLVVLVVSVAVLVVIGAAARAAWREHRAAPSRVAYPTDRIEDPLVAAINRTHAARETGTSRGGPGPHGARVSTDRSDGGAARLPVPLTEGKRGSVTEPAAAVQAPVRSPTWVTRLEPHPTVLSTWRVDPDQFDGVVRPDHGSRRSA